MDPSKVDALSAEGLVYPMPTIAKSAHNRRKIGMGVQKLLIWGALKQICFMNARNMVLRKGEEL